MSLSTMATLREVISTELRKMCDVFGKTRKRRWTEYRQVRISGSSDAVPELT